jgi:hypothetical protein
MRSYLAYALIYIYRFHLKREFRSLKIQIVKVVDDKQSSSSYFPFIYRKSNKQDVAHSIS